MSTRKTIGLTGFITLVIALAVISLGNQAAMPLVNTNVNPARAPRPVVTPAPILAEPKSTPIPRQELPATNSIVPVPVPVPTPDTGLETADTPPNNSVTGLILSAGLILFSLYNLAVLLKRQLANPQLPSVQKSTIQQGVIGLILALLLMGCQTKEPDPLPPDEYLDNALSWLQANAVTAARVDWETVRAEVLTLAPQPQTTADTYPAIEYALDQLNDSQAFMTTPEKSVWEAAGLGITAVYPQNIIVEVKEGGPAAEDGIQVGDRVLAINDALPRPRDTHPHQVDFLFDPLRAQSITLVLQRDEEQWETTLTEKVFDFESQPVSHTFSVMGQTVAYLELPTNVGTRMYPTQAQAAMADVDSANTCGWMIDLRRTRGGDLWTYFAALSPILGEGELGGFVYTDGSREMWTLREGKVFWADEEREESYVRGPLYELERPLPPVALLISPLTEAAGELVAVAFQGWGNVRTFGEPTLGSPHLILHTPLSDGARLFVSGAQGMDRSGKVYNGSIMPDEPVPIDWQHLGNGNDPVISAALDWLATQPTCKP